MNLSREIIIQKYQQDLRTRKQYIVRKIKELRQELDCIQRDIRGICKNKRKCPEEFKQIPKKIKSSKRSNQMNAIVPPPPPPDLKNNKKNGHCVEFEDIYFEVTTSGSHIFIIWNQYEHKMHFMNVYNFKQTDILIPYLKLLDKTDPQVEDFNNEPQRVVTVQKRIARSKHQKWKKVMRFLDGDNVVHHKFLGGGFLYNIEQHIMKLWDQFNNRPKNMSQIELDWMQNLYHNRSLYYCVLQDWISEYVDLRKDVTEVDFRYNVGGGQDRYVVWTQTNHQVPPCHNELIQKTNFYRMMVKAHHDYHFVTATNRTKADILQKNQAMFQNHPNLKQDFLDLWPTHNDILGIEV